MFASKFRGLNRHLKNNFLTIASFKHISNFCFLYILNEHPCFNVKFLTMFTKDGAT